MNWVTGRQMNSETRETSEDKQPESRTPSARLGDKSSGRHMESRTPPPGKSLTPLKKELRTATVNWFGNNILYSLYTYTLQVGPIVNFPVGR